jgi:hypothetical protein
MYAFLVFVALSLGLLVLADVIHELNPVKIPNALRHTVTVLIAIGVAWALDYSVFTAFGQDLRSSWMNPVATGVVLVGAGEFMRALASGLGLNISIGSRGRTA